MNLFWSEEHVVRWPGYDPSAVEGTLPVREWADVFGVEFCRTKLAPDFFLHALALRQGLFRALKELGKSGPFWGLAPEVSAP
ncbi:MAG: hypothetical protein DMD91_27505 [Candidatus Rokuibacteriota bacterium]|nr:MAG: hypothetical protein DMD91_27505 [Candidatus Rokubacteria bacterium]